MYKVTVNLPQTKEENANVFELEHTKDNVILNKEAFEWDLQKTGDNKYHIIYNNQSFRTEVVKVDYTTKTFHLKINGKVLELAVKDRFDLLLEKMGMNNVSSAKINQVKAPMPGLILDIKASEGQDVQKGDVLLILEAMKMENVIKSPTDAKIKTLKVKKGDSVEKNQVLIVFE